MSGKRRLTEWAKWRLDYKFSVPIGSTMGRVKDDQENAGAGAGEFHYDMIDGVPCIPDGGLPAFAWRARNAIDRDNRCRLTDALVRTADYNTLQLIELTYSGPHQRHVRKSAALCAGIMRIKVEEYRERMRTVYAWVEYGLGLRRPERRAA